jgi:hypothetical protein
MSSVQVSVKAIRDHPKKKGWKLVTLVVENTSNREVSIDTIEYRWKDGSTGEKIVDLSLDAGETLTLNVAVPDKFLEEGDTLAVVYFYSDEAAVLSDELKRMLKEGKS